jgi:hypothetical protein
MRIALCSKKLAAAVDEEQRQHPGASVEIWAMDEHRIGLKPIVRGVWAPIGERPIALGHHRFEWLYVTGFLEPATGRTVFRQRRLQGTVRTHPCRFCQIGRRRR